MILQQNSVPVNEFLGESTLYSNFPCKMTLLDVALMLDRRNAASLLLFHGAEENDDCKLRFIFLGENRETFLYQCPGFFIFRECR